MSLRGSSSSIYLGAASCRHLSSILAHYVPPTFGLSLSWCFETKGSHAEVPHHSGLTSLVHR